MYFWAEKYFSGTGLEQQQASAAGAGGARRGSRTGSGGIDRKGSYHAQQQSSQQQTDGEHRKSVGQLAAARRESRGAEKAAQAQRIAGGGRRRKSTAAGAALDAGGARAHRSSTLGELAAAAAVGNASTTAILLNIGRALAVRALLMAHALLCIWAAGETRADSSVWAFALLAVCLVGEGFYAVVVRAGDDPKWFSPAIVLYLFAAVPPLWLLYASICPASSSVLLNNTACVVSSSTPSLGLQPNAQRQDTAGQQLLGHSLFLTLLGARWLLPRAELSREELTQILLAQAAIWYSFIQFSELRWKRLIKIRHTFLMVLL